jgi:hypothetical protein
MPAFTPVLRPAEAEMGGLDAPEAVERSVDVAVVDVDEGDGDDNEDEGVIGPEDDIVTSSFE